MCLFTADLYSQCKHVECNLIRTIQLQNTVVFPQAQSLNNDSQSQQVNGYHNYVNESESVHQNHSHVSNIVIQEKQLNPNQFSVKQQSPEIPMIAQNHHTVSYQFDGSMVNEKGSNGHVLSQGMMLNDQQSQKTAEGRIKSLQMQVKLLKNGMENLVKTLKDKNVINQRDYQDQMTFLQQFQSQKQN